MNCEWTAWRCARRHGRVWCSAGASVALLRDGADRATVAEAAAALLCAGETRRAIALRARSPPCRRPLTHGTHCWMGYTAWEDNRTSTSMQTSYTQHEFKITQTKQSFIHLTWSSVHPYSVTAAFHITTLTLGFNTIELYRCFRPGGTFSFYSSFFFLNFVLRAPFIWTFFSFYFTY